MSATHNIQVGHFGDYTLQQKIDRRRDRHTGHITLVPQSIDEVLRNGVRIGYCGRHTGAPFTPIVRLSPGEADDVLKAIAAIRFEEGLFGPPGRATTAPDPVATDAAIADMIARQHDEYREENEEDGDDQFDTELALEPTE